MASAPLLLLACECCAAEQAGRITGRYDLHCVRCCARLVRSCRPWREAQEAMLAVIARQSGRPDKAAVLAALRALDAEAAPALLQNPGVSQK